MRGHYFHQDLLVARGIYEADPRRHIDIGSRTDGFVAHVAVFRGIEILDIRQLSSEVENVRFRRADLMELPADLVQCTDSLSSLHALEHFGLGRYGDPVDIEGHVKALGNMHHMLERKGTLYLSVSKVRRRLGRLTATMAVASSNLRSIPVAPSAKTSRTKRVGRKCRRRPCLSGDPPE